MSVHALSPLSEAGRPAPRAANTNAPFTLPFGGADYCALTPATAALARVVAADPHLRQTLSQALEEAGSRAPAADIPGLMAAIDTTITRAIPFTTDLLVGCPLNALFEPLMRTRGGQAFFHAPAANAALRDVLDQWACWLDTPASSGYLDATPDTGWFGPEALAAIDMADFQCDPLAPHWGYASWNAYFTRGFRPGARPIAAPDDTRVITAACEATPYALASDVRLQDRFWAKGQPYSLIDMFGAHRADLARHFEGGDIYQGFLSAHNYHRWNAPIAGTVVAAYTLPGTYFADLESEDPDAGSLDHAQAYLSAVAARAVMVIKADDPKLGLVACLFIGMAEISSCRITTPLGAHVAKGDELGHFQYGGSTHCLVFQRDVVKEWLVDQGEAPVRMGEAIARA